MQLNELWRVYEAEKRIQGYSPHTLKGYSIQFNLLIRELGDIESEEITLTLLKEYLARKSHRLKPSSLGIGYVLYDLSFVMPLRKDLLHATQRRS